MANNIDIGMAEPTEALDVLTDVDAEVGSDQSTDDHNANLALFVGERVRARLADNIIEWVDADEQSRKDWQDREARGIRMMGVSDNHEGGADFKGASRIVHPLLAEACVQFNARAMSELWPPDGPVKTQVLGEHTPEREMQAERVKGFMNYQYTTMIPGARDDHDTMLLRLPLSGSCFKKIYFDPIEQMPMPRYIEPSRFTCRIRRRRCERRRGIRTSIMKIGTRRGLRCAMVFTSMRIWTSRLQGMRT